LFQARRFGGDHWIERRRLRDFADLGVIAACDLRASRIYGPRPLGRRTRRFVIRRARTTMFYHHGPRLWPAQLGVGERLGNRPYPPAGRITASPSSRELDDHRVQWRQFFCPFCPGDGPRDRRERGLHSAPWLLQTRVALVVIANTTAISANPGIMADVVRNVVGGPHFLFVVLCGRIAMAMQFLPDIRAMSRS
jgi:hypothetical protein